jgi:hypothetical protein
VIEKAKTLPLITLIGLDQHGSEGFQHEPDRQGLITRDHQITRSFLISVISVNQRSDFL